jgi:hypothetical protein
MGWNTTVLILNDALHEISHDPDFGKKLESGILRVGGRGEATDVCAGNHVNAVRVIESHHADDTVVVKVGGNIGYVMGATYGGRESPLNDEVLLRVMADKLGFKLVKKNYKPSKQGEE